MGEIYEYDDKIRKNAKGFLSYGKRLKCDAQLFICV